MTRFELLKLVVGRAHTNGFEFRRWYTARLGLPWINAEAALRLLDGQRRYYALLFSHEFASNFWKTGTEITFELPAASFDRVMPDGSVRTIQRKPFIRRSARPDVWRYHLQQMALAEEPLRYLRRYLQVPDQLEPDPEPPRRPRGRPRRDAQPNRQRRRRETRSKKAGRPAPASHRETQLPQTPVSRFHALFVTARRANTASAANTAFAIHPA